MDIKNTTSISVPKLPFEKIKNYVLGFKYELSLVFIGDKRSQRLNKTYRDKNKPTNVLSFPIEKNVGEIFINLPLVKRTAKDWDKNTTQFVAMLFIHGLFHLKGLQHGSTMDKKEAQTRAKFEV